MKIYNFNTRPLKVLVIGFLCCILIGSLLLKLPMAYNGELLWLDALFTATSAVTVTGLSVVDTAHFTLFGQTIIMLLIQIGGLGFMTLAITAMLSIGLKIGSTSQHIVQEALGEVPFNLVAHTARSVVLFALLFESIGVIGLTLIWWQDVGFKYALYKALFYSISAFNNAGFALSSDSLMPYVTNIPVNLIISVLIILGGLGFTIFIDIKKNKRWKKYSFYTRLILLSTLILNLFAFILIFYLERNNPNTLGQFDLSGKLTAAWFQAISPRTAGFNSIPIQDMTDGSTFITILLMFIGGGSLSTASGIKIGTLVVLIIATISYVKRKENVTIFHYTITTEQVFRALSLFCISLCLISISFFILLLIEPDHHFLDILFEVVSALGTVGLSRGMTGELTTLGKIIIMLMMFIGRLGPLTIAYAIALPVRSKIKYPNATIYIG